MIAWALEALVASTLLMILVLAIRKPVARVFGPSIAYALWILPVARMLLPPLPQGWREQAVAPVAAAGDVIAIYIVEPLTAGPVDTVEAAATPWYLGGLPLIGALWLIGAAGFLAFHALSHSRFRRELLQRGRVTGAAADGRVQVIESDAADGPLAFGIWHKYVAFPCDFSERYDDDERELALAHELGHHVRGDLIANWVALVVLAIHWFNPVAWRAFRAFRADQEMACDALVLASREPALRYAYGRAIVKSAHGGAVSAACHLHTVNDLKGRLRMLAKSNRKSPLRMGAGLAGATLLTVAGLGLTASGTQAAEKLKSQVEQSIGVDFAALDAVTPTVPPTPVLGSQDVPEAPEAPDAPAVPAVPDVPEAPIAPVAAVTPVAAMAPVAAPAPVAPPAPPAPPSFVAGEPGVVYNFSDGKGRRNHRVVVRDERGFEQLRNLRVDVPQIRDGKCGLSGNAEEMVIERRDGRQHKMIICTDRIEAHAAAAAARAQADAMRSKRMGLQTAMISLRHARASIVAQRDLSEDRRAEALNGIDEAIAELQREPDSDD